MAREPKWVTAFPDLAADLDPVLVKRVSAVLELDPPSAALSRPEVQDVVDRVSGRISFEEYLRRSRARRS